jgi:Dolichyl-phosphate-mannose-protein mannosyltransferase
MRRPDAPAAERRPAPRLLRDEPWSLVAGTLAVYAASRVVVAVAAATAAYLRGATRVVDVLVSWDGGWYLEIVRSGYPAEPAERAGSLLPNTTAFFPAYPLLVRAADRLLPGREAVAALAVSLVAGAAATVLVALLTRRLTGPRPAVRAAALFAFSPGAFVLSMPYAEGVMLVAATACLLLLHQRRWVAAGLAAAVASAARPSGLVLAACCAWAAWEAWRQDRALRPLAAPLLAPLGTVAYFGYLWVHTGSATTWFRTQRDGWHERIDWGDATVDKVVEFLRHPFDDPAVTVVVLGLVVAVAGVVLLVTTDLPRTLYVYTAGILFLAVASATLGARPRFVFTAFPLAIAAGMRLRGAAYSAVLGTAAGLLAVLVVFYSKGYFELIPGAPAP